MESIGGMVAFGNSGDVVCANLDIIRESLAVALHGRTVFGESGVCAVVVRIPRDLWRDADYDVGVS